LDPLALVETPIEFHSLAAQPLVTILVANYNYAPFLGAAIESVLTQSYQRLELIVCDDGSTDDSRDVISSYLHRDERMRAIYKENAGQASAWNAGYAQSRGDVICFLDSDDLFAKQKVELVVETFDRGDCGFLQHQLTMIDRDGKEIGKVPTFAKLEQGWLAKEVERRGGRWLGQSSSALSLRRELGRYVFPIPHTVRYADEFVYTLSPLVTKVAALNVPLAQYRVHRRNFSNAGRRPDLVKLERSLTATRIVSEEVNQRMLNVGSAHSPIQLSRNLRYLESQLVWNLLYQGISRVELIKEYARLARAILSDDLYSRPRKYVNLFAYGTAIWLPRLIRTWWLGEALGYGRARQFFRHVLRSRNDDRRFRSKFRGSANGKPQSGWESPLT
jgi:glycosyltransferase involved in cell wall biosynthesis